MVDDDCGGADRGRVLRGSQVNQFSFGNREADSQCVFLPLHCAEVLQEGLDVVSGREGSDGDGEVVDIRNDDSLRDR